MLIFLRCMQMRPQAVTEDVAVVEGIGRAPAGRCRGAVEAA